MIHQVFADLRRVMHHSQPVFAQFRLGSDARSFQDHRRHDRPCRQDHLVPGAGLMRLALHAVSYTHLDVYKRQPFGALDAKVRKELRQGLREIHDTTGLTTIFVTHDQDEALELADLSLIHI